MKLTQRREEIKRKWNKMENSLQRVNHGFQTVE